MDEETPHMHLVFIPVVHTTDKKGNNIDKIACSEFWKEKDSYRILQDNFFEFMVSHNFNLERGLENGRVHLSVEDYKKITDFEKTKATIQDIELDLPEIPNIKDFNKLMIGRDEKIQELIIKPKDKIIQKLYEDNRTLNYEIVKQINLVDKAERYEKERKSILLENVVNSTYSTISSKI
ncbi:MAG: plasmid recombination protein [Clostridia bacterium]|nr:plasmid recombination protein [Clostridia bacterium]